MIRFTHRIVDVLLDGGTEELDVVHRQQFGDSEGRDGWHEYFPERISGASSSPSVGRYTPSWVESCLSWLWQLLFS